MIARGMQAAFRNFPSFPVFEKLLRFPPFRLFFRLPLPTRIWIGAFALWIVFLTGIFSGWTRSPGVLQNMKLQELLDAKQSKIHALEAEIALLESEAQTLEKSKALQQREIRRVLGYAASDEIIFDFTDSGAIKPQPSH